MLNICSYFSAIDDATSGTGPSRKRKSSPSTARCDDGPVSKVSRNAVSLQNWRTLPPTAGRLDLIEEQLIGVCRQTSQAEMTHFVLHHGQALPTSSVMAPSLSGSVENTRPIVMSSQDPTGPPTQMMVPLSLNVKQGSPRSTEAPQGQFVPAQVASVNVNTGGNMATKGPIRQVLSSPGSLSTVNPGPGMPVQPVTPTDGQMSSLATPPQVRLLLQLA